jgi:hypothetical protein
MYNIHDLGFISFINPVEIGLKLCLLFMVVCTSISIDFLLIYYMIINGFCSYSFQKGFVLWHCVSVD